MAFAIAKTRGSGIDGFYELITYLVLGYFTILLICALAYALTPSLVGHGDDDQHIDPYLAVAFTAIVLAAMSIIILLPRGA